MNQQIREIIQRMEAHFLPAELERRRQAALARTTHEGLDDKDVFSKDPISLQDVLDLKRVLNRTGEPVKREHYNTVHEAYYIYPNTQVDGYLDYDLRWRRLVDEKERALLIYELDKPRLLPPPTLPDRELTVEEKCRLLKQLRGFTRYGVNGHDKWIYVPTGNGLDTTELKVKDTAIHRRLEEIYKELKAIEDSLLPPEAKDTTPHEGKTYWSKGDQWRSVHIKTCSYCSATTDVKL